MTRKFHRRAARRASVLALAAMLASPALAQEATAPARDTAPPDSVAIDVGRTARSFGEWASLFATQFALAAARFAVDLTYDSVESGPDGAVYVNGLRIVLPVPFGPPRSCVVSVDEIASRYSTLALFTGGYLGESSARVTGISVPLDCLPPEARPMVQLARLESIEIDAVEIDTALDPVTARADIALRIDARDLATIDARGRLDYLWLRFPLDGGDETAADDEEAGSPDPVPSIEFGPMDVTVVDRGLVERLPPFLGMAGMPPEAVAPTLAQIVRAQVGSPELAESVEREMARFLSDGGRLALSLRPGELWFDELGRMSPSQAVAAFNPSLGASVRPEVVSPALIEAARQTDGLAPDMALQVAKAHLAGEGLPRNPDAALRVALAHAGDGAGGNAELRAVAAEAVLAGGGLEGDRAVDLADAYRFAIDAGRLGHAATPLLRRMEAALPSEAIVAVQARALGEWRGEDATAMNRRYQTALENGDTADIVAIAGMFETGRGAPRNHAEAYFLALLAEAAGEVGARRLVDRIEAATEGDAAWRPRLANARNSATRVWLSSGLAARVAARANGEAPTGGGAAAPEPDGVAPPAPPAPGGENAPGRE